MLTKLTLCITRLPWLDFQESGQSNGLAVITPGVIDRQLGECQGRAGEISQVMFSVHTFVSLLTLLASGLIVACCDSEEHISLFSQAMAPIYEECGQISGDTPFGQTGIFLIVALGTGRKKKQMQLVSTAMGNGEVYSRLKGLVKSDFDDFLVLQRKQLADFAEKLKTDFLSDFERQFTVYQPPNRERDRLKMQLEKYIASAHEILRGPVRDKLRKALTENTEVYTSSTNPYADQLEAVGVEIPSSPALHGTNAATIDGGEIEESDDYVEE